MRNILGLLVFLVFACGKKETEQVSNSKDAVATVDSVSPAPIVGADEDAHGCKTSAGYTWSFVKNECVRIFEAGTALKPVDTSGVQMAAFVIFEGDKAELFVQTEKPLILMRKAEGEPFTGAGWQLIPWKGYVLKKDGKILYTGK
ncbi:Lipoprotein [Flavobacterium longum]|uniref:hypothetical protein n=1 Tax=Flavobacterium longum TaxID=1299340 RepID=UPI0039E9A312